MRTIRSFSTAAALLLSVILLPGAGQVMAITPELPFWEDFEPTDGGWGYQQEWQACERYGGDPYCPNDPLLPLCRYPVECSAKYGPLKFESWPDAANGGKVYSGLRSGRQPIWDPYWGAILHPFRHPSGLGDLRLKLWQYDFASILCDCDPWGPPSRPNFDVHGWLVLTNPYRTEYYVLAVNTKQSWTHLAWATKTDGWHVSSTPRATGWRKMEILVHPYSGNVGDVEFLVNDEVIAQGRRDPGGCHGQQVNWLRLGGDPALLPESHLTNTFEEFWYDEVELTFNPLGCFDPSMDFDGDCDVDQEDFGLFQLCLTGSDDPEGLFNPLYCHCMDADDDNDVDQDDFGVFQACASGPGVTADTSCDDPPPP